MNKIYTTLLFAFVSIAGYAQDEKTVIPMQKIQDAEEIYNTAGIEVKPEFPGGTGEFYNYIAKNFKTPDVKGGLSGRIFVSFVIEKDGSVTDIKVLRDIGWGTKEETIRVLKNSPKWKPGQQLGKNVRVLYSLPIVIQPRK